MLENLINKLIEEAKIKAKKIIEKGQKEFEERLKIEREKIRKNFEELLEKEKKKIDSEIEKEIINCKLELEKEILAIKNSLIEEVMNKIEKKFNEFLNENMEDIIRKVLESLDMANVKIFVPYGKQVNLNVIYDEKLKNSFLIKGGHWEIEFSWKNLKDIFEKRIKEKTNKILFYEQIK